MTVNRLVLSALALGLAGGLHLTQAQAVEGVAARCEALSKLDFATVQDAPTQIIEAKLVEASEIRPGHCFVSGYVVPNVGFILRLPLGQWNGKLTQVACGAFCGSTDDQMYAFNCTDPLRRGYACILSDNGHKSSPFDALWAYDNLHTEIDQAYRGPHVTALAGKAIVQRYFGQAPRKSYFMGCSNGGRQALIAAQRFPWDFDGIIAGAPELSLPEHFMSLLWANRALTNEAGEAILGQAEISALHQAVLAKCDMNDGIEDGLIGDPRLCTFDPSQLACSAVNRSGCLNPAQLAGVKKLYQGPVTSTGEQIYPPSVLPGSELTWPSFVAATDYPNRILLQYFRYMAFQPDAGPAWTPQDFDFDRDYRRQGTTMALHGAVNPDLRAFKAAGGKLLAYTGWNDIYVSPLSSADYYETVERTLGGRAATQDFFRLFVMPGMNHCGGGDGAYAVDYLSYLEAWVEQGRAPDEVLSHNVMEEDLQAGIKSGDRAAIREWKRRREFPLDLTRVKFSRPVYPYPVRTRYRGRGDSKDASSFWAVRP